MRNRLAAPALLLLAVGCTQAPPPPPPTAAVAAERMMARKAKRTKCGVERWDVKVLNDAKADQVHFTPVIPTTIAELNTKPKHCALGPDERVYSEEFNVYEVVGEITYVAQQADRDIHIALRDPDHHSKTMVVEVIDPTCPGAKSSSFKDRLKSVRDVFMTDVLGDGSFDDLVGEKVRVVGVGFFDKKHPSGVIGASKDCIELHPVLSIEIVP